MVRLLVGAFFILLASCTTAYNLTDRSGNVFVIEHPEVETKGAWEYRAGDAVRELHISEIVSLSVPNAEPRIFDGRIFYPATLALEDTVSVPAHGFICVEGELKADNAGKKITIHLSNIKEFSIRQEEKEKKNEDKSNENKLNKEKPSEEKLNENEPKESVPEEGTGN
jgi:hypothetical protein